MASSSSSSDAISSKKYHVFISFRGEDTRENFTSHLHDALCKNNIETYIDYRLEKGEEVWPSLEKAIHESMMFLIVFSENYASSTWCLKELTTILDQCSKEEGLHVIPVFYKIDPSDIRKQKGKYRIAFKNHEKSNPKQQVLKWRDDLTHAANLSGWHSSIYRNESELIQQIVKHMLKKLVPVYQDICLEGLVGVKEKVEDVELLMHNSSPDVRFIGIWGMAGIGKTTIAKALFNKLCFSFDSFCFLANVREQFEKFGIVYITNKLLSTLIEDKESYKGMPDGGSTYAQMRLRQMKVLVVLDDINNTEQLESLARSHHWFGPGSRIIITTRDKEALGPNLDLVYEVELLMLFQALQLFKMKAFKDNYCDDEFECLSLAVVDYAKGLPLALTVLGRSLYGKDKIVWESQLEKLRKMPHKDIQTILRLSYKGLDREEKDIFLFIACFFNGGSVEYIKDLLDASGYSTTVGLRGLQDKALLTFSEGHVSMHDLIQEMGMEIVREESLEDPGKRSRLWDAKVICLILKDNKGSDTIKSITLDMSKGEEDLRLSPEAFSRMSNLLFLEIYNSGSSIKHVVHLPQGLRYFPNKLRYLCWHNYPSKSLPPAFSAENLVKLFMPNSGMRKLWQGVQNVVNLKRINLSNSRHLEELPDFSKAKNLETVELENCTSICKIHPSILSLNKLKTLRLKGCVALSSLKSDTESKSLGYLYVDGCSNLKEFSVEAQNMRMLHLEETAIEEVPSCIGRMPNLCYLFLPHGKCMRCMPSNLFDGLHSLYDLKLGHISNLYDVVNNIRLMSSLTGLRIEGSSIESLPETFPFTNLKVLKLIKCTRLKYLPSQLPLSLTDLRVEDCAVLQSLTQLPPSLDKLYVIKCPNIQSLPELPPSLSYLLYVDDCQDLRSLPQLPPSLRYLKVHNCSSLETVQVTSTTGKLQEAVFENCMKLDEHSAKAILANVILVRNKYSSADYFLTDLAVRYPGRRVPQWFKYKTTHPSILVDLSSAPLSSNWCLLHCIITPMLPSRGFISVRCRYQIHIVIDDIELYELAKWNTDSDFKVQDRTSNYVNLWFDQTVCQQICQIQERIPTSNSKLLLQLEFDCLFEDIWNLSKLPIEIMEYGVCPTYSWECQNFLNEIGLESQASTSQVEVTCSYDIQDDENDSSSNSFSVEDSEEDTLVSNTCQPLQAVKMELIKRGFCNNRCLPCWCL